MAEVEVDVEAALRVVRSSMTKQLGEFSNKPKRSEHCSIFRVPSSVRDHNKSDYDPKVISIGPYHHGAPALQAMESLKWSYLHDLIARSEANMLDTYITTIFGRDPEIREYYSEQIERDPAAFVEMMVVDGCFIVEFLIKRYENKDAAKWNLPLLHNDLLLLENQVPFFVLREIFRVTTVPNPKIKDITLWELANSFCAPFNYKERKEASSSDPPEAERTPHHLLHLCHRAYKPGRVDKDGAPAASCFSNMAIWAMQIVSGLFFGLLALILSCRLHKGGQSRAPWGTRSATELKEAGVKFCRKKKKKNKADSFSLLDVTFGGGTMTIPKLSIRETTPSWLRNLLAFELCYPQAGSHFTSYTALLNNLVDTPDDVAVLRKHDIIKSKLGGDDDVAKLFNELCRGAYLDYKDHHFAKLFKDVKQYSDAPRHKWRATLVHDYFGSPWAIISVIAAVILLALTLAQTFFTIFPYYHPRS